MDNTTSEHKHNAISNEAVALARDTVRTIAQYWEDGTFEKIVLLSVVQNPKLLEAILARSNEAAIEPAKPGNNWVGMLECTECKRKQMPICNNRVCGLATLAPLTKP